MQTKKTSDKKKYLRKKNHHLINAGAGIATPNDSKRSNSLNRSHSRELIDPSYLVDDRKLKNTSDMISENDPNIIDSSVPITQNQLFSPESVFQSKDVAKQQRLSHFSKDKGVSLQSEENEASIDKEAKVVQPRSTKKEQVHQHESQREPQREAKKSYEQKVVEKERRKSLNSLKKQLHTNLFKVENIETEGVFETQNIPTSKVSPSNEKEGQIKEQKLGAKKKQSNHYVARTPSNLFKVIDEYETPRGKAKQTLAANYIDDGMQNAIEMSLQDLGQPAKNELADEQVPKLISNSAPQLAKEYQTPQFHGKALPPEIEMKKVTHFQPEEFGAEEEAGFTSEDLSDEEMVNNAVRMSEFSRGDNINIVSFQDSNINQLIHHNRDSGLFANIWSKLMFISHTYNFITVWYFLGIIGFPEGWWLVVELLVEVIVLFDLIIRTYLKNRMPNQWRTMWLLQDKEETKMGFSFILNIICSIPQSLIFCLMFMHDHTMLFTIQVAALRSLKLIKFSHISKFFETKEIENHTAQTLQVVNFRSIQVVFYFLLATHMIGCIWLIIGRIDTNRNNWFVMAKYEDHDTNVREVTVFEKYVDSVFYTVATMTGLGYGNIVPSTNLEYFVDIFIMITGSSIYAGFFADFAVEIYNQNKKHIENDQKLEQAKQFAAQRNLPDDIRERVRQYYNNLRVNYQILRDKYQILHQLPLTLRSELSLFFNCQLIQQVKFFQLAEPSFILMMTRCFTPQLCLQKDFVIEVGQVATQMFFIEQGIVQILANDNKTVIAFQSQGCYFGEIGILLTEKRTCSVKAITMCIFMTIQREELENIFDHYPQQGKFLRAIGRQRLLTTDPEDLIDFEENVFEIDDGENVLVEDFEDKMGQISNQTINFLESRNMNNALKRKQTVLNVKRISSILPSSSSSSSSSEDEQEQQDEIAGSTERNNEYLSPSTVSGGLGKSDSIIESMSPWQRCKHKAKVLFRPKKRRIKIHLTEQFRSTKEFVIIPFSKLYNFWTTIIFMGTAYFFMMIPYQLALNYDIYQESGIWYLLPDIFFTIIFILDIFFRSRVGFVVNQRGESEIQTDQNQIQSYYINNLLIYDIMAAIPFDYLLLPFSSFGLSSSLLRQLRILKFFKTKRTIEGIYILKKHSDIPISLITFVMFFVIYIILAHFMATAYIFIGIREVGKQSRFDGQSMFEDITSRNFITPEEGIVDKDFEYLTPAIEMSKSELYVQFIYLSSCTMGAVMYGDIIPFAMSEQLFDFIAMFTCRLFLAFLFAEAASFLSSVHKSQSQHTKRLANIKEWSIQNHLPKELIHRIIRFYEILWLNFRGVRQQHILQDLPDTLMHDVRQHIFKNIIENWDMVLDNKENGVISSIIQKLELRIIPQDEFIIKYGEIGQEMYFIIKGTVKIISQQGIQLNELGVGKNFGETALLLENNVRTASVQAATDVSVAIMSTTDFTKICEVYPQFKERIIEGMQKREHQNKLTINKVMKQSIRISEQLNLKEMTKPLQTLDFSSESEDINERLASHKKRPSHSILSPPHKKESPGSGIRQYHFHTMDNREPNTNPGTNQNTFEHKSNPLSEQNHEQTMGIEKNEQTLHFKNDNQTDKNRSNVEESKTHRRLLSNQSSFELSNVVGIPIEKDEIAKVEEVKEPARRVTDETPKIKKERSDDKVPPKIVISKVDSQMNTSMSLHKRIQRVPLRSSGINEHFNLGETTEENKIKDFIIKYTSTRNFMKWSIVSMSIYNLVFIPLQFGYRIKFQGIYLLLEVFTIVIYIADIFYRTKNLWLLQETGGNIVNSENFIESTLMDDKDQFIKRQQSLKAEIVQSAIAFVPFSFIFQVYEVYTPLIIIDGLCLLRVVKIMPIIKIFEQLKSGNMQKWRVIEVVVFYYIICHVVTGVWISMGQFEDDVRETWIRRIRVPQELGMRQNPTLDDVSSLSLYIHGLYFVVNTISHVAIGDITAVTTQERIFVALLILFGTFIYCFLYGNIVSIVSDFAPTQHITYFEQYQYVMQRLETLKNKKDLMQSINEYFDYIWGHEQHSIEQQFMNDLPQGIRQDILLCKYQEAIENSLIFKDDQGAIDISLTNSIFKVLEVRIYMTNEFIFKCGSHSNETIIILEGHAMLLGACQSYQFNPDNIDPIQQEADVIGAMKAGSHFGNDMQTQNKVYGYKRLCHLVCRQPSVVGIISQEKLNILYNSFPKLKEKIQSLNQFTFEKCKRNFESYDHLIKKQMQETSSFLKPTSTKEEARMLYIEQHLTFSTQEVYEKILHNLTVYESSHRIVDFFSHQNNMLIMQKMFFYGQEGKVFPIFDNEYQEEMKKQSHQNLLLQMLAGQDLSNSKEMKAKLQKKEKKVSTILMDVWDQIYLKANSKGRTLFDLCQIINLLYIAVVTPLIVGFKIEMTEEINLVEMWSILFSLVWIIGNFRTQVLIKGVPTLKFRTLLKHYKQNGFYYDLCGIIPLNLMIGSNFDPDSIVFTSIARVIRVINAWRAVYLFGNIEVSLRKNQFNIIMQVLKALFYIFFLGHFLACLWYFICENCQSGLEPTWIDYNELRDQHKYIQYLRSIYTIFNIVCSVGYGDMFPMTDIERIFFTMMITMGDLLFAIAFGLITRLTLQISLTNETRQFKDKMYQIQEFMSSFNLDPAQQRRVEQYFAYEYQQKYNSNLLMYNDLGSYLPYGLREEVIYRSSKDLLQEMFDEFNSENLIRQLSCVLESVIFLPGDYIIYKGDYGDEMYFIAEGSVYILSQDKQTVITTLQKGSYFGEIAILHECKRTSYVQAVTFCIINILKKEDFDNIAKNFPEIEQKLIKRAQERVEEMLLMDNQVDEVEGEVGLNNLQNLQNKEILSLHEQFSQNLAGPTLLMGKEGSIIQEERSSQYDSSTNSLNEKTEQHFFNSREIKSPSVEHQSEKSSDKQKQVQQTYRSHEAVAGSTPTPIENRKEPSCQLDDNNELNIVGKNNVPILEVSGVSPKNQTTRVDQRGGSIQKSVQIYQMDVDIDVPNANLPNPKPISKKPPGIIVSRPSQIIQIGKEEEQKVNDQISNSHLRIKEDERSQGGSSSRSRHSRDDAPPLVKAKTKLSISINLNELDKDKSQENITSSKDSLQGFFSPVHKEGQSLSFAHNFNTENMFKKEDTQNQPFKILQKNHTSFSFQKQDTSNTQFRRGSMSVNKRPTINQNILRQTLSGSNQDQIQGLLKVNLLNMMRSSNIEIEEKPPNIMNRNSKISRKVTLSHQGIRRDNSFKMYHSAGEYSKKDTQKSSQPKQSLVRSSQTHMSKNSRASGTNNNSTNQGSSKAKPKKCLRKKSHTSLSTIFKGSQEQQINHTIRRTLAQHKMQLCFSPEPEHEVKEEPKKMKKVRRLSRISLGKNLTLSQTAGLKLQWTVCN